MGAQTNVDSERVVEETPSLRPHRGKRSLVAGFAAYNADNLVPSPTICLALAFISSQPPSTMQAVIIPKGHAMNILSFQPVRYARLGVPVGLRGRPAQLHGPPIDSGNPSLFCIVFGLSMDYEEDALRIHRNGAYRRQHLAVSNGLQKTVLINGAAAIMVVVFSAFGFHRSLSSNRSWFGFGHLHRCRVRAPVVSTMRLMGNRRRPSCGPQHPIQHQPRR